MKDSLRTGEKMHTAAIEKQKKLVQDRKIEEERMRQHKLEEKRNKKIAQQQLLVNSLKPQIEANARLFLKDCKPYAEERPPSSN
jgi:hypothetical protein